MQRFGMALVSTCALVSVFCTPSASWERVAARVAREHVGAKARSAPGAQGERRVATPIPSPRFRSPQEVRYVALGVEALRSEPPSRITLWREKAPEGAGVARKQPQPAPPIALTDPNGQGLKLLGLRARGLVEGSQAFTELHLTFQNPEPRVIEGRFSVVLPPQASIARFAMRQAEGWQEAELVERAFAEQVYEDFLHRKVDPALLEKKAGNLFEARVFPIPSRGTKELIISYSEALVGGAPYRLQLQGLPVIGDLDVSVLLPAGGPAATRRLCQRNAQPLQDFTLALGSPQATPGLAHGRLVALPVRPRVTDQAQPLGGLLVLVDTSASRTLGFQAQLDRLASLVKALAARQSRELRLGVAAFDQGIRVIYSGPAAEFGPAALARLRARGPLGASDLHRALSWAATQKGYGRVLVITDAVPTAGEREAPVLRGAVARLHGAFERLDVLLTGGIRDAELAAQLTRGLLAQDGVVLKDEESAETWVTRLGRATLSAVRVEVTGARWVWPDTLDGLQAGGEELIYAELKRPAGAEARIVLSGTISETQVVVLRNASPALLERAVAAAELARLRHLRARMPVTEKTKRETLTKQMIALSMKHRVLSDETALLVLETEEDYARYKIDRRALGDVLAMGPRGLDHRRARRVTAVRTPVVASAAPRDERVRAAGDGPAANRPSSASSGRARAPRFSRDSAVSSEAEDALVALVGNTVGSELGRGGRASRAQRAPQAPRLGRGAGMLSALSGGGFGLGGGGAGAGSGARRPQVFMSRAEVTSSLDVTPIRRVIRRHLQELRHCYVSLGLPDNPALAGTVRVGFVIGQNGLVASAVVRSSTLGHRTTEQCVIAAVRRWRFPRPEGYRPVVIYPFTFRPVGGVGVPPGSRDTSSQAEPVEERIASYSGRMAEVMGSLASGKRDRALEQALAWRASEPGSALVYVALGEALKTLGDHAQAARAFGSIIDLYPSRADLRRFAAGRLETLGAAGIALAVDSYQEAVRQRPDHPSGHRLLAYALLSAGQPERAFRALEAALGRSYSERYLEARRILGEDLELVAAAWAAKAPARRPEILRSLKSLGRLPSDKPSLRFVLTWETDANDVDFHIHDRHGHHASYRDPKLASGGALYANVTTGYGPESFTIPGVPQAYPYRLEAHYYNRGPMGYGMGKLDVIRHDGKGHLQHEVRPFVVMNDGAFVPLGTVTKPR